MFHNKSIAHLPPSPLTEFHTPLPCLLPLIPDLTKGSPKAGDPLLWPSPCHPGRSIAPATALRPSSKLTVDYESFRSKSKSVTKTFLVRFRGVLWLVAFLYLPEKF